MTAPTALISQGLRLETHLARPSDTSPAAPALVLCHGFPGGAPEARDAGASYPELADRIAREGLDRAHVPVPGLWSLRR